MTTEIKKVSQQKDGTKILVVPKRSDIEAGDYVKIIKIDLEANNSSD